MGVESLTDMAVFVNPDDFGIAVSYTPAGGSPMSLNVIWDDPDERLVFGGEANFEASKPELTLRDSDLPAGHANRDTLVIHGDNYKRVEYRPDGTGMGIMRVQKV